MTAEIAGKWQERKNKQISANIMKNINNSKEMWKRRKYNKYNNGENREENDRKSTHMKYKEMRKMKMRNSSSEMTMTQKQ